MLPTEIIFSQIKQSFTQGIFRAKSVFKVSNKVYLKSANKVYLLVKICLYSK